LTKTDQSLAAKENAVLYLLRDGRLRTTDEIQQEVGFDPVIALNGLFEQGKVSITRAAGVGFWQKHP
jgi:hypothetical protein